MYDDYDYSYLYPETYQDSCPDDTPPVTGGGSIPNACTSNSTNPVTTNAGGGNVCKDEPKNAVTRERSDFTQSFPFERVYKKDQAPGKHKHVGGAVIGLSFIVTFAYILSLFLYSCTGVGLFVENWYESGELPAKPTMQTVQSVEPQQTYTSQPAAREDKINTEFNNDNAGIVINNEANRVLTAAEVFKAVNPATVMIVSRAAANSEDMKAGTGVIFDSNGFIVTNQHVVGQMEDYTVILADKSIYDAHLVAESTPYDIAILKIEATNLPTVTFGNPDAVEIGEPVYAIGNPLSIDLRASLTTGVLSGRDRFLDLGNNNKIVMLQTDAALNSGNSGGPLINRFGQVIGINSNKISGFIAGAEGLGFAIPSTTVQLVVNTLLNGGTMDPDISFGLLVEGIGVEVAPGLFGLRVNAVAPEGASEKAGIMANDIITEADGQTLYLSSDLLLIRTHHKAGDKVPMVIYRNGEKIEVVVEPF